MTKEKMTKEATCVVDNVLEDFLFYFTEYGSKSGELTYKTIAEIFIKEFSDVMNQVALELEVSEDE